MVREMLINLSSRIYSVQNSYPNKRANNPAPAMLLSVGRRLLLNGIIDQTRQKAKIAYYQFKTSHYRVIVLDKLPANAEVIPIRIFLTRITQ